MFTEWITRLHFHSFTKATGLVKKGVFNEAFTAFFLNQLTTTRLEIIQLSKYDQHTIHNKTNIYVDMYV